MAAPEEEEEVASTPEGVSFGRRRHAQGGGSSAPSEPRTGWGVSESKDAGRRVLPEGSPTAGGGGGGAADDLDDSGVEIIHDADEEEADLTTKVAEAPRNVARKVQSMAELDHNINFAEAAAAAVRSGAYGKTVDLSLLTSALVPPSKMVEEDEPWEFTSLLQECAQAHQADADRLESGADALKLTAETDAPTGVGGATTFGGETAAMTTRGGGITGTIRQRGPLAGAAAPGGGAGSAGHK